MSGLELLDRLHDAGVNLPTIVITGTAHTAVSVRAVVRAPRMLAVLHKPFRDTALLKAVRNTLGKKRR
jgi:FixJ family two-component response regulator